MGLVEELRRRSTHKERRRAERAQYERVTVDYRMPQHPDGPRGRRVRSADRALARAVEHDRRFAREAAATRDILRGMPLGRRLDALLRKSLARRNPDVASVRTLVRSLAGGRT